MKVTGGIPALLWMRPRVIYEEGKRVRFKNAMLCANHNSFTDPVLMQCAFWYKKLHSLATAELFDGKLKHFFFHNIYCIPVDKQNFSMSSFHAVCDRLEGGEPVLIFPEGGLVADAEAEMRALKSGVVLMAHKTSSPIIPIYIAPLERWYHRRTLVVGQPIDVRALCGDRPGMVAMENVTALLRRREIALRELYENQYRRSKKQ